MRACHRQTCEDSLASKRNWRRDWRIRRQSRQGHRQAMTDIRRELLVRGQIALRASNGELAAMLGSSKRTAERWSAGRATPSASQYATLAALVHATDPALAAQIAAIAGQTLESLGIVAPPPPVAPPETPAAPPCT